MQKLWVLFLTYKEIILYVFFGGMTTIVNLVSYALFTRLLNINDYVAIFLSWVLAVFFAYITNKIWVFESQSREFKELFREITSFAAARVATLGLEYVVMFIGVDILFINDMLVKVFAQVLVIVANYLFSKLFIFKKV